REYMTDDQRFASRRPDVVVFETDTLTNDVTLAGPLYADLFASISTTDADFVVKLIDVFPDSFRYADDMAPTRSLSGSYPMGGYQMLVRGEVMRGRFRKSFEKPEPFTPNKVEEVKFYLPDIAHTFKKGHRIMVQVQSSWFPLVDRNPQKFVDIYQAKAGDFQKAQVKIYHSNQYPSSVVLPVVNK
ncbi:MAG: CocE/NonD family hydrolase, partial [Flavisolibacter sp.]